MCLKLVLGQVVQAARGDSWLQSLCSHPAHQLKKGNTNPSSPTEVLCYPKTLVLQSLVTRGNSDVSATEGAFKIFWGMMGRVGGNGAWG